MMMELLYLKAHGLGVFSFFRLGQPKGEGDSIHDLEGIEGEKWPKILKVLERFGFGFSFLLRVG